MAWEVEYTDEFARWWDSLSHAEQHSVAAVVGVLEELGPNLPFPHSSGVVGSAYSHMRELRIQHSGKPYRVLYAFDPRRVALLLLGGTKVGDNRWYVRLIPQADQLYREHLATLSDEGLIDG